MFLFGVLEGLLGLVAVAALLEEGLDDPARVGEEV